ncbi:MAG: acetyl-CoA carboxylase biotin carboxylase subunit [Chitinophagales bacterium]|nr:acetyl-CoA carboxylase biotin carboxylase subunit [Bacteroidota bacterium]MCB9042409.1 acetyl-CoA carboxylase biotin carboxylase subunit [Chitinophagales bacterium]
MIKKVLIANRGEIALRIMRSLREMNIATVAVYSDADRLAPHVRYADEAVHIGESPSASSYLKMDTIINTALRVKADAIHPGFGFLSENATFARKVKDARIIFIGPSPESIEIMGSKLAAKEAVKKYNIPLVPGTESAIQDAVEAAEIAQKIGFPVLIKASAGGGGKGMRIVHQAEDFAEQLKMAQSEALSAFGDGSVFMEKYVRSPRHIEIQILGDMHGNIVYLHERECSIQRRHQKVIEEAPSVVLSPELRKEMGECAVNVARSCNYYGAGTVEFLLDDQHNFYFLEMNTRLQVEHPVTEMITQIDLVKQQINIAEGKKLNFTQKDIPLMGHAIELRVYAEDPENNFLPDIGKLLRYRKPEGLGVRVDDGFEEGMDIPIYYDPMLAKLIVHAPTRTEALARMVRAIDEYKIAGVKSTLAFGKWVMQHPKFVSGKFDTHFIPQYFKPEYLAEADDELEKIAAQMVVFISEAAAKLNTKNNSAPASATMSNWRKRRG